ncbi:MAG: hypothetical protein ACREOU_10145 [Candidatus Eiseniibacteriota bacterium]
MNDSALRVDASVIVYRLHDVGYEVNLERAAECLAASAPERRRPAARTEAQAIRIANPPVTVALATEQIRLGELPLTARVTARLFDFAVVSLRVEIALPADMEWPAFVEFARRVDLVPECAPLFDRSLASLLERIRPAVTAHAVAPVTEDYIVFRLDAIRTNGGPASPAAFREDDLASILLGEKEPLAESARRELLPHRFSYFTDDLAILTWNGALIVEPSVEDTDVQYVLEFANAQLLELRVYDDLLDRELPRLYAQVAARRGGPAALLGRRYAAVLARIQRLMADTTEFVERVENALKVTDDVYLARIYSTALEIFRGRTWRAGIDRKIGILRDTYSMLSGEAQAARSELLELAIVALIVLEIVLAFVRN